MRLVENNRTPGLIEDPGYNYAARGVNKPGRQQPQTRDMSLAGREREKKQTTGALNYEKTASFTRVPLIGLMANMKMLPKSATRVDLSKVNQQQPFPLFCYFHWFVLVSFLFFFCDYFLPSTLVPPCNVLGPLAATAPWKESAHRFSNHIVTFP